MYHYLKNRHSGTFGPDEAQLIISAYDDVWANVQNTGAPLEGNFESIRMDLAKHIVETAIEGERDPVQLREAGLAFLKENGLL